MLDQIKDWALLLLSIFSVGYLGWRTMKNQERAAKRQEQQDKIVYWQQVAEDLTRRFDKLEARCVHLEQTIARYRMMKDYVFEVLGPEDTVVINAQMILDGRLEHRRRKSDDDLSESKI